MGLGHTGLCALFDIVEQCLEKFQGSLAAIHVAGAFLIRQKNMVGARPSLNIDVFAHLNAAVRACHKQAAIAPGGQAIGCEPIDPDVSAMGRCLQNHFTKIFKMRIG